MIVGYQCMLQGMTEDHDMTEVQIPRSLHAELELPVIEEPNSRDVSDEIAKRIMDAAGWHTSLNITGWWISCQALHRR